MTSRQWRARTSWAVVVLVIVGALVAITFSRHDEGADLTPAAGPAGTPSASADLLARFESTPSPRPGKVVDVDYSTRYDGKTIDKQALVYLPSGYDEQDQGTRYDVLYLMHGAGMDAESFLGGTGQTSTLKNILDNMIEAGQLPPTIVVAPTFYPDEDASFDLHYAGELDRAFPRELENDLMPAVEGRYHTYARTIDAAGFTASREHRAFAGFSMGAVTTWYVFIENLDYFKFFMPMAGDSWVIQDSGGASAPEETAAYLNRVTQESGYRRSDFLIATSVGSSDGTSYQMAPQIREMRRFPDSFDSGESGNLRYTLDPGGGHDLQSVYRQFYRSVQFFF